MVISRPAVSEYLELGIDAIPLKPGSKAALLAGWPLLKPSEQWSGAPLDANIGIRAGGALGLAVIDSDDKKAPTWFNVQDFLFGLGWEPGSYPVVTTPHGGRHVYLSLQGHLEGDYRLLIDGLGAGELRYGPGALVAAPPSVIADGRYTLAGGDWRQLPIIQTTDILPLLKVATTISQPADAGAIPSRRALAMLRGEGVENYTSRSEAEQAVLLSLANSGLEFDEVISLFLQYPAAGKFFELYQKDPTAALRWLKGSYQKAQQYAERHDSADRRQARRLIAWAEQLSWPGRAGSSNRAVYLAHLNIAYRAAKLEYGASSRELAELAGLSRKAAERASRRLLRNGYLSLVKPATPELAAVYSLPLQNIPTPSAECEGVGTFCTSGHDAFRWSGLGKSASEVYGALLQGSDTAQALAERTGRHIATVKRALGRMSRLQDMETGQPYPMVEAVGEIWRALPVDLDKCALLVGSAGALSKQQAEHKRERYNHRKQKGYGW